MEGKREMSLDTIGDFDGGALRMEVNRVLKVISDDLDSRPGLKKARKLTIEVVFTPQINPNAASLTLEEVQIEWAATTKIPEMRSKGLVAKRKQNGTMYFHTDLPESPDDRSIMDEAERRQEERRKREQQQ